MSETILKVGGMSCQGCVKSVTRVLQELPGVARADVSLDPAQARVTYDETRVGVEAMKQAIVQAGFDAA